MLAEVFPPALRETLIAYYDRLRGEDSGFMRDINGQTASFVDHGFNQRGDQMAPTRIGLRLLKAERFNSLIGPNSVAIWESIRAGETAKLAAGTERQG